MKGKRANGCFVPKLWNALKWIKHEHQHEHWLIKSFPVLLDPLHHASCNRGLCVLLKIQEDPCECQECLVWMHHISLIHIQAKADRLDIINDRLQPAPKAPIIYQLTVNGCIVIKLLPLLMILFHANLPCNYILPLWNHCMPHEILQVI